MEQNKQLEAADQGAFQPSTVLKTSGTFFQPATRHYLPHFEAHLARETTRMTTELQVTTLPSIINDQTRIENFLIKNYVRKGDRFAHVDRPSTLLAKPALIPSVRIQLEKRHPGSKVSADLVKKAIETVLDPDADDINRLLSVWSEGFVCRPGDTRRILPNDTGTVDLNTWSEPAYRGLVVEPNSGVFRDFFLAIFPDDVQRRMVLDWLKFCLQNEQDRPRWGLMLYSQEKGTGKSTFAKICRALFGSENSITLNGVSKLTQKFSATSLTKKFVNCEEVDIRPNGQQVNDLKALFTDDKMALERKGTEVEQTDLTGVFLFTSNHIPNFLKGLDRRLYVIEVSHDGHASGANAAEFGNLVERVEAALEDDQQVAALYTFLKRGLISPGFNPNSLNTATHSTPIMRQILGAEDADRQLLSEFLDQRESNAITLDDLVHFGRSSLRKTTGDVQAMMVNLGWKQQKAKWGGATYSRSIFVRPGFVADGGRLHGDDGFDESLASHIEKNTLH